MSKISDARREAHLAKMYRWPDGKVESMRDRVTAMVATGQARLTYRHGTGRKVEGCYRPTRPVWVLWVGNSGVDVTKIAAELAVSLMASPPDLRAMEEQGEAAYQQAMR
jgi:alkanesulfonate monooxygenase SsuD/methylene tetrahydromethanopterin reductase-like flavin-dependent oxidoreductase (luciferase family)